MRRSPAHARLGIPGHSPGPISQLQGLHVWIVVWDNESAGEMDSRVLGPTSESGRSVSEVCIKKKQSISFRRDIYGDVW